MKVVVPVSILAVTLLAAASFRCGIYWAQRSDEATASDHAVWISRTWMEGMSIEDLCSVAAKAGNVPILRDEWDSGAGEDIALGPVVSGRRICIRRDRFIYWRAAQ